jgi:outer membrane lipoprotein
MGRVRRQPQGLKLLGGLSVLLLLLVCSACAPAISKHLRQQAEPAVSFAALQTDPGAYQGRIVILGGIIAQVTPQTGGTEVEVVQKPLDYFQEPKSTDTSQGRFLVKADRFLDPLVFRQDRKITVAGAVIGSEVRKLQDMDYRYVLVQGQEIKLWPLTPPEPWPSPWPCGYGLPVYYYWGPCRPMPYWLW